MAILDQKMKEFIMTGVPDAQEPFINGEEIKLTNEEINGGGSKEELPKTFMQ